MELTKQEQAIIQIMREHTDGFYKFSIEKRPTPDHPEGEITRVFIEKSELVGNFRESVVN